MLVGCTPTACRNGEVRLVIEEGDLRLGRWWGAEGRESGGVCGDKIWYCV